MKVLRHILESIAAHARECNPLECCGILLIEGPTSPVVTRILRARNTAKNPREHYVLGAKAHIRAVEMEAAGVARIAGYYHSHPDGECTPTQRDIDHAVPNVPHLIVGLGNGSPEYGLWRLEENRFTQNPLEVRE